MNHNKIAGLLSFDEKKYFTKRHRDCGFKMITDYLLIAYTHLGEQQFVSIINLVKSMNDGIKNFDIIETIVLRPTFDLKALDLLINNIRKHEKAKTIQD